MAENSLGAKVSSVRVASRRIGSRMALLAAREHRDHEQALEYWARPGTTGIVRVRSDPRREGASAVTGGLVVGPGGDGRVRPVVRR